MSERSDAQVRSGDDFDRVVDALVDMSLHFLKKSGNFLPHGACVLADGKIALVMAGPEEGEMTTSEEILPRLHRALNDMVADEGVRAVATAENVEIGLDTGVTTDAVKVVYENSAGVAVACYTPFRKRVLRGYATKPGIVSEATPEIVGAWSAPA